MAAFDVELDAQQREHVERAVLAVRAASSARTEEANLTAAHAIHDLRGCFQDRDGRPDYAGTSSRYRGAAAEVYERAARGDRKEAQRVNRAVQYHMATVRQERMTPEEIAAYGLAPKTRAAQRREQRHSLASPTDGPGVARAAENLREVAEAIAASTCGRLPGLVPTVRDDAIDHLRGAERAIQRIVENITQRRR
ncbi:hypothetical protein EV193_104376 [Herbihabitans rhizosphaerae]|uniref:Uncharacterized protein n=1 Tax=Herbihabitans rhizosphaerae TaxID=1872711 RepID=A0A4Q7KSQ7_9PSEU|nr:hypothetical protein [Herbihabitans rhizosphaerae]RZS39160.1 hypothetical protein EV193_104376 [Herbihabitans rhizosphaerae]